GNRVASQTRRRFGGRQPLCGMGVMSRILRTSMPAAAKARIADSRPEPGPLTRTSTLRTPWSRARFAAFIAACCAANGVPLRDPRKPSDPELFHERTFPAVSEMVTIVLLKEAWICATPCGTCLRSFFLNCFFLPFFSGTAPPPLAAGFAISQFSVLGSWFSVKSRISCSSTENRQPRTENRFLRFRRRLLLNRDCSLTRTLSRTRVGMRTLPAHRQVAAVAVPTIRADFDESLDVHRNFLAQVAFHHSLALDDLADAVDLVFREILHLLHGIDLRLVQNPGGSRVSNSVNVSQRDIHVLVTWKIDACNTCHSAPRFCRRIPALLPIPDAACAWRSRRSPAPHPCGG